MNARSIADPGVSRRTFLATATKSAALIGASVLSRRSIAAGAAGTADERSPITNAWGSAKTTKVDVDHRCIFRGSEGHGYSHQHQLLFHDGRLHATWSLGLRDEEGPGQRMVMSVSEDRGKTWSKPATIAPSRPGRFANSIVISSGLRIHEGTMVAYYGEWERAQGAINPDGFRNARNTNDDLLDSRTEARISRDGGATWSGPTLIMPRIVNYMPPAPAARGRLIFPGNLTYAYTDDAAGLRGWRRTAVPGIPADYIDDYFNMLKGRSLIGGEQLYTEASFFQTDDSVIHMMLRNTNVPMLGVTESRDNGETWSRPRLTNFTDAVCRAQFGRLPDGRFFAMSCPNPALAAGGLRRHRTPAVLAVSHDGIAFDRHFVLGDEAETEPRLPGLFKHGQYGYPYLHLVGDQGFLIYSRNKEDIWVGRFSVAAIRS